MTPELDPEQVKEFVLAGHMDFAKVQALLAENPALLNAAHPWSETDLETALTAAGHVGNHEIAEFLLDQGAPLDICVAAMLGRIEDVRSLLQSDSDLANARGAHGISLMFHAAMSGDTDLATLLRDKGCNEGYSHALHGAVNFGHTALVEWLLETGVENINMQNFQGKTPLTVAFEGGHAEIAELLRQHGGRET